VSGRRRVLVAVDDSEGAARAVRFAASVAGALDAEVLAVILLGGTFLWLLGVHGRAPNAAALRRLARETKRLLLHGAVRPRAHAQLVRAVRNGAVRRRRP